MRLSLRPLWFAALLLAGCENSPLLRDGEFDDYRYNFRRECFCPPEITQPVTIEVRDGVVTRVVSLKTGQEITDYRPFWPTIQDLIDRLKAARRDGEDVRVEYDRRFGYPTLLELGTLADDSGVRYLASDYEEL